MTVFLRLLSSTISKKGDDLRQMIADINQGNTPEGIFWVNPSAFSTIIGTPFPYWAQDLLGTFTKFSSLETSFGKVIRGPEPYDMLKSLRLWVEVNPELIGSNTKWVSYAKGGEFKPYSADVHMVINYEFHRDGVEPFRRPGDQQFYFLPGLTFTQRTTSRLSFRVMNADCLTSPKGPGIIPNNPENLWFLMAIGNSRVFQEIVELKVGAADVAARSYDLHILRDAPVPKPSKEVYNEISALVQLAVNVSQTAESVNEMSRLFVLPILFGKTLKESIVNTRIREKIGNQDLQEIQNQLDEIITSLYELDNHVALINEKIDQHSPYPDVSSKELVQEEENDEDESYDSEITNGENDKRYVERLFQWILGCVFGRWDIRFALDLRKSPSLPSPFDPLPVCSPGMLVGANGLPLISSPDDYPLPVAWDGFLVDDPGHPRDIISAVRGVINLLWHDQAEAIEAEACQILGTPDLRSWFRDPRGYFAYHIKRYSKSRRKAPIYWLLQSAKRNYGIWLYYPRLNPDSLFRAGREYADAKLNLEAGHLNDMQNSLSAAVGSARKVQELKIATQAALVAELKTFQKALDAAALLEIKPDLNDGVLMNIAHLYELVPWKEAERAWQELLRGKYEWSSIGKRLRHKGLVKG